MALVLSIHDRFQVIHKHLPLGIYLNHTRQLIRELVCNLLGILRYIRKVPHSFNFLFTNEISDLPHLQVSS